MLLQYAGVCELGGKHSMGQDAGENGQVFFPPAAETNVHMLGWQKNMQV